MKKTSLMLIATLTLSQSLFASLIVYNSNIGLVHEERNISLKKSDTQIIYKDVASTIDTDSVNVKLPSWVTLYSQQYRYDKLTKNKLLDAYIGKNIQVNDRNVTLLSYSGSDALVREKNKQIRSVKSKDITFEEIPKTLLLKPSLVWNIKAHKSLNAVMELDYLIKNISFKSDYILNVKGDRAKLSGWITINNRSGKNFTNTELSLLAGDINRVQNEIQPVMYKQVRMLADSPQVSQQAYEGYHFYTIPFKVTLANNEKTQIKFLTKNALKIKREYESRLSNPLYLRGEHKSDVTQFISLEKLDIPLPQGIVRTYAKLKNQTILLGQTQLAHTPKNTKIKLKIGKNFDIKTRQKVLKREDTKQWLRSTVLYSVTNASQEKKHVTLLVPFNKDIHSSIKTKQKYAFTKGNLVTFSITVAPNATKNFKVTYESKR
ncbi:hypothetical protein [Sulfurimonas sp.]|uniref:DUF4139 domain-containing protein n=1 Tax=Sulfurimonas sp. TaxID=2022749 RepID=UPI002617CE16|nr:hypothetical protein [Sulfurimonas sp.]